MALALSAPRLLMFGALALGLGAAGAAAAHAIVVGSQPQINASVKQGSTAPLEVWIRFNSRLDKARSKLALVGPDGAETDLATATEGPLELLQARTRLGLPGSYRLRWRVLAADGHITRGDIPFTVTE